MPFLKLFIPLLFFAFSGTLIAQDISLYRQFNGQFDYLAFGNTLNLEENGHGSICDILTSSSADFQLENGQEIEAAYLYWAGSGPGDFEVTFEQTPINAQRTFYYTFVSGNTEYIYFAAFAEVTEQMQAKGNGNYTLSELDLTDIIPAYCSPVGNATNFGGWAVTVIYKDENLPYNQVNVFDGLQGVHRDNQNLNLQLDNLMVLDIEGAKIGFLAWEGDRDIAVNETLKFNGNILSNLPLNPANNAFNGTNSFTSSDQLYNMDIDFYNISNYIDIGDTSAEIQLRSGQDFVMINNIITVLNTALPDASISIDNVTVPIACDNREIFIEYTVYNLNATAELPAQTPIAFYADEVLVGQSLTLEYISINSHESSTLTLNIPINIPDDFTLKVVVDDIGDGTGIVPELNEENNSDETQIHLSTNPIITGIVDLQKCLTIGTVYFDLTQATASLNPEYDISYHLTEEDAQTSTSPISDTQNYENLENPQTIFVRVNNADCFLVDSFKIEIIECPLPDATISFPEVSACRDRVLNLPYTVYNIEATGELPANVSIAFYFEDTLLAMSSTQNIIPIDRSEDGMVEIILPEELPDLFELTAVVDDDGFGNSNVEELREDNNSFSRWIKFASIPPIPNLPNLQMCDQGFSTAIFNLREQDYLIDPNDEGSVNYFTSIQDALEDRNSIPDSQGYSNLSNPQTIFVRLDNAICFAINSFLLNIESCKPFIPQGFSPNSDGINDFFKISNLLDIYKDFELQIYSRNGNLIHIGHNKDGFWDGVATRGLLFKGHLVPVGTYYYVLYLRDEKYPEAFIGWLYINY